MQHYGNSIVIRPCMGSVPHGRTIRVMGALAFTLSFVTAFLPESNNVVSVLLMTGSLLIIFYHNKVLKNEYEIPGEFKLWTKHRRMTCTVQERTFVKRKPDLVVFETKVDVLFGPSRIIREAYFLVGNSSSPKGYMLKHNRSVIS